MSKPTPGPWEIDDADGIAVVGRSGGYAIIAQEGPLTVCPARAHSLPDARLIAAAPEMFEALLRAREAVEAIVLSTRSVSFDADLRAIDVAIAKATGEQSPSEKFEADLSAIKEAIR